MQRNCRQCGNTFEVTDTDLAFLQKVSPTFNSKRYDISPPILCPDCRSQLRSMHRNERSLHKRTCDLCSRSIIAMYPADAPFPVYCQPCFFGDGWNPQDYGREYDTHRSFFGQYAELLSAVPHLGIINKQCQNSVYCNYAYQQKDCYLTFGSHYEEDCLYDAYATRNRDSMDFLWMYGSELVYKSLFIRNCYRCVYLEHCENCNECLFSRDLRGCAHCLFCVNLHQKQYCIFNEQHTKEEYERKLTELAVHTYTGFCEAQRIFHGQLTQRFPVRASYQIHSENCEGSIHMNCKNMRHCFDCADSEDCTYGFQVDNTHDSMDIDYMGYDRSEHSYQLIGCLGLFDSIACNACWHGSDLRYCQFCFSCQNCFCSASLRQQSHCILNKQYDERAFQTLVEQIVTDMKRRNEWGSFFPASLSPFCYNETMSNDWFPLTKEVALERGYRWYEHDEKPDDVDKVTSAAKLPESIDDIPDDILNWALICTETKRPFRIVQKELNFYRQMRLPIPRIHPEKRHLKRTARRHPRKLWQRTCAKCEKQLMTSYASERPEKVYCEKCYLEAVN